MVFNDLAEDASGYRYGKHYGYGKLRQISYSPNTKQATAGA
jgi:hypothetical protein